jgi:hypothetical protein
MAEIVLHSLNRQCLYRNMSSADLVVREVDAWQKDRNNRLRKINWQFTTADARIKLKKLYLSIHE